MISVSWPSRTYLIDTHVKRIEYLNTNNDFDAIIRMVYGMKMLVEIEGWLMEYYDGKSATRVCNAMQCNA